MGVWGCPLSPGPGEGGIGAAHGSQEQFNRSIGVSRDSSNNSWRYKGVPLTPETTQRVYLGIPWPRKQTIGTMPAGMYIA